MTNIEIERIQGARKAFPKAYEGTAVGGYNVWITYENHVLELRVARAPYNPRVGLVVVSRRVSDAPPHDIADERMVQELERAGVMFQGRRRVISVRG